MRVSPTLHATPLSDFDLPLRRPLLNASPSLFSVKKSGEFSLKPSGVEVADESESVTWPETVEHRQDRRLLFGRSESPHIIGRAIRQSDGH